MRFTKAVSLLSLTLAACSSGESTGESSQLSDAKAQFETANLDSYSFTWTQSCFCDLARGRATRISVTGDTITRAIYVDDHTQSQNTDIRTIDGVFAWIDRAYDQHYDTIDITYDAELGYPTKIYFDPVKNASDEETQVVLSNFTTPADAVE